jgi:hypothetical protein
MHPLFATSFLFGKIGLPFVIRDGGLFLSDSFGKLGEHYLAGIPLLAGTPVSFSGESLDEHIARQSC